jgi:uncharacterized protein (DUF58 family)
MDVRWVVFLAVILSILQNVIYRWFAMRGLSYSRTFNVPAAFPGETAEIVEVIENVKPLPLPWLRLESMIPASLRFASQSNLDIDEGEVYQNHKSLFSLRPYTRITRRHSITCLRRGVFTLQSATMTCGDLFGMSVQTMQLKMNAAIYVYPALVPLSDIPLPAHSWQGDYTVRRWIVSDPFITAGVREYRPGDPMNRLNWKATARSGTMQIHREDFTANQRLMIYINFDLHEQMWGAVTDPEAIETAICYAASIANYALQQGMEVGFGCNGYFIDSDRGGKRPVRIEPTAGSGQLYSLLTAMARLEIARCAPFDTLLEADLAQRVGSTDYLIMTAYRNDKLEGLATRLRGLGNALQWMEIELPENHSAGGGGAVETADDETTADHGVGGSRLAGGM